MTFSFPSFHRMTLLLAGLLLLTPALAQSFELVPVIPGAVGFGIETRAGREGQVLRVTNLDDSGPGSLREAIETSGPRVVVFDVAGVIRLDSHIRVHEPYLTVAGQTAPSPGITITGYTLTARAHDVLIQHLRFRPGDGPGPDPQDRDGLKLQGGKHANFNLYNVVVDHCSISWAMDEGLSLWYPGIHDVTIRNCIIAENLSRSLHPDGEHSKGLIVGDGSRRVAILGNLLAHNRDRNPLLKTGTSSVVANNVIYNYGHNPITMQAEKDPKNYSPITATIISNIIIPGKNTPDNPTPLRLFHFGQRKPALLNLGNRVFASYAEAARDHRVPAELDKGRPRSAPIWVEGLRPLSPAAAVEEIVAQAGARPLDRDPVDERIIDDFLNQRGQMIDSPSEVGGLPTMPLVRRQAAPPPSGAPGADGYTALDKWLISQANLLIQGMP